MNLFSIAIFIVSMVRGETDGRPDLMEFFHHQTIVLLLSFFQFSYIKANKDAKPH